MYETIKDVAVEEFSQLNKKRFREILTNKNDAPILLITRNEKIVEKMTKSHKLKHDIVIRSINSQINSEINLIRPKMVLLDTDIEIDINRLVVELRSLNIPLIYILNRKEDLDDDKLLTSSHSFIYEDYTIEEVELTIEMTLNNYYNNIEKLQRYENRLHQKNAELFIEKFYSIMVFTFSIVLILDGVISRNVTFIQWIIFIPALLNLVLALISLKSQKKPRGDNKTFVSLVIPAYNEENTIESTVRSIESLDYEYNGLKNFEIIVVNDGSVDNTGKILKNLKKDIDNLRIITRQPPRSGKGKGFVLNDALVLARGEIIGVFDADTIVKKDYLSKVMSYFDDDVDALQSRVRMYNRDENFLARMQDVEFGVFGNVLRAKDIIGYNAFLGGNGQFVRRDAILSAGKWDGFAVTEDLNLSVKVSLNGGNIRYCPEAAIYQEAVSTWHAFMRQRVRWAMGNFETLFIFSSRILFSKISVTQKIGILTHVSFYAFNLFIFAGFIIFIINALAWFVFDIPTVVRMDAPLIIALTSAIAFLPSIIISLHGDGRKGLSLIKEIIEYWLYSFYLIPLFFMTMWTLITRRERKWAKTVHKGSDVNEKKGCAI